MTSSADIKKMQMWLSNASELANKANLTFKAEQLNVLRDKLERQEVYLAFIGATSSGKSTIINNLLNKKILPAEPIPTTGAIILVKIVKESHKQAFYKVNTDTQETIVIDEHEFSNLAQEGFGDGFLIVEVPFDGNLPEGSTLMDVPGYNSLNTKHDFIVSEWFQQMDIIYWVIGAKQGVAKSDKRFWDYSGFNSAQEEAPEVSLIINCPNENYRKRVPEIQKKAMGLIPQISNIFQFAYQDRINNHTILDVSELQGAIRQFMGTEIRQQILYRRILELTCAWLIDIQETAKAIQEQSDNKSKVTLEKLSEWEANLEEQNRKAVQLLSSYSDKFVEKSFAEVETLKTKLWNNIEDELEKATTIKASEAINFIFNTQIREIIEDAHRESIQILEHEALQLSQNLETIWMDPLSREWAPEMRNSHYNPDNSADNVILEKISNMAVKRASINYLGRLGGRAGESGVVGVMNLTKKGLGKINKLGRFLGKDGSIFGKEAMNEVGSILQKFGLTTVRVTEAFAFVATEIIMFCYKATTWRGKVIKKLKPILSEIPSTKDEIRPIIKFRDGLDLTKKELISCFKDECDIIYKRRLESLNASRSHHIESKENSDKESVLMKIREMNFL